MVKSLLKGTFDPSLSPWTVHRFTLVIVRGQTDSPASKSV